MRSKSYYHSRQTTWSDTSADTPMRRPAGEVVMSDGDGRSGIFECNICLEELREPVLTPCGHLYCWSCLFRWLALTDHNTGGACPVCQASVSADDVIPVYGRPARKIMPESRRVNFHAQRGAASRRCDVAGERGGGECGGDSDNGSRAEPHIPSRPSARRPVIRSASRSHVDTHTFGASPSLFGLQFQPAPLYLTPATRKQKKLLSCVLWALLCLILFCLGVF